MRSLSSFSKVLFIMLLFSSTIFAQLELSVYADKIDYQYGELIELYCKVTNNADTTFKFLAGSYQSCQAEFSFNEFNSWERTRCLTMSEMLTFKPHSSKTYSWIINPEVYGLPNNDGAQMIIGKYYFGLVDTIYINAPQYLGGQLDVGFLEGNSDSLESIKDSLSITVLSHNEYNGKINEQWQVEGFQIDSLISHFRKDSILTYIEKSVLVKYESIVDKNPLDYYPLHVGDMWQYFVKEKQSEEEITKLVTIKVRGKEVIDGKEYFTLTNSENYCLQYLRIDSTDATIWELKEGSECMIDSLTMLPNSKGFTNQCFGSSECVSDTTKIIFGEERGIKKFYYTDGTTCMFCTRGSYEYAENIGKTISHILNPAPDGFEGSYRIDSLVYAEIDGVEYGEYISENLNPDVAFYPLHVGDTWQYKVVFDTVREDEDTTYYSITQVIGKDTLNGKIYFTIANSDESTRYVRIDSTDATVWEYLDKSECMIDSLTLGVDEYGFESECASILCMEDTVRIIFEEEKRVKTFRTSAVVTFGTTQKYQYAFGVGQVLSVNTEINVWAEVTTKTLVYAKIDGVEYGTDPTDVEKTYNNKIDFSLSQNYPNPFNPSTVIRYEIGDTKFVTLKVYNTLGQEVAVIVNKEQKAGNYSIKFDASHLTSGAYYCILQYGSSIKTIKMLLIK